MHDASVEVPAVHLKLTYFVRNTKSNAKEKKSRIMNYQNFN